MPAEKIGLLMSYLDNFIKKSLFGEAIPQTGNTVKLTSLNYFFSENTRFDAISGLGNKVFPSR